MSTIRRWIGNEDLTIQDEQMIPEVDLEIAQNDSAMQSIEEDVARSSEVLESACGDLEQLQDYHEFVSNANLKGDGLSSETAQAIEVAVEAVVNRLGLKDKSWIDPIPGIEHFNTSRRKSMSALAAEGMGETVMKGIKAVITFIRNTIETIVNFLERVFSKVSSLERKAAGLEKVARRHDYRTNDELGDRTFIHSSTSRGFATSHEGTNKAVFSPDRVFEAHKKFSGIVLESFANVEAHLNELVQHPEKAGNDDSNDEMFNMLVETFKKHGVRGDSGKNNLISMTDFINGVTLGAMVHEGSMGGTSLKIELNKTVGEYNPQTDGLIPCPDKTTISEQLKRFHEILGPTKKLVDLKHGIRRMGESWIKALEKANSDPERSGNISTAVADIRANLGYIRDLVLAGIKLNVQFMDVTLGYVAWGLDPTKMK